MNIFKRVLCVGFFILVLMSFMKSESNQSKIKYMKFHNQTILRGVIRNVQRYIVRKHNKFRSVVKPAASNMLRMRWHVGAAKSAQNWANQCMFLTHDDSKGRNDKNYGACGQNIFVSTHPVQWLFAMRTWFAEKKYFTYGSTKNNLKLVGHYTQMVWATSQFVGCGFAKCDKNSGFPGKSTYYNYVCNYCPSGNKQGKIGLPYKSGKSCGICPNSCKEKLCTNGCPFSNVYSNCDDLYKNHTHFVCHTLGNQCKSTCKCKGRIYE